MLYCVADMIQFDHGDIGLTCVQYPYGKTFRPIPYKSYLFWKNHNIYLGSLVMFQWGEELSLRLPHSEDIMFTHFAPQSRMKYVEFLAFFNEHSSLSKEEKLPFHDMGYIPREKGYPEFSVATYKVLSQHIELEDRIFPPRCRLTFTTSEGCTFRGIPVIDNRYFNVTDQGLKQLKKEINKSQYVFIRIGLSREQDIEEDKGCYYQVQGIYPDKGLYRDR